MPLSFEKDIKPLFTSEDRDCMLNFGLDLGEYADVKNAADHILQRVEAGEMPPPDEDRPWPADRVATFSLWIKEGSPA